MFRLTKTHISLLACGALTVAGATYLHAQDKYPPPAATPAAAAQDFYRLLETISTALNDGPRSPYPNYRIDGDGATDTYFHFATGAVSRAQMQAIDKASSPQTSLQLLSMLAYQKDAPRYQTRVTDEIGNATIVEIAPSASAKREVVTIAEDGGYRVDLKATYGRWNNLSGEKLDLKWYEMTKITAPLLLGNPVFIKTREKERRSGCQSNLKQQMLGLLQYSQDYDEKLPSARRWIDVLQPYVKSEEIFICPSLQAAGVRGNGYAFNQYLSQKPQSLIYDMTSTVAIYETSNPRRNWFGPGTGRAYRHEGGSNIAFADGHVKWFLKGQEKGVKFKPTFSAGY